MRRVLALLTIALGLGAKAYGQTACTGLCLQQAICTNNATTSITGVVYAPNGVDPLPNVTVYVPNAPVDAFTPGVSCPVVGAAPSGSPLVGTTTAVDGSFTLTNVPVGSNIPLVIVSGRWRRQLVIPSVTACTNTALPSTFAVMPQNQSQGDIPLIAIATGSSDQVECVLRKVGISDSEFTDVGGGGRINIYQGSNSPGALIDPATPSETALMSNAAALNAYDMLMVPCQGAQYIQPAGSLANMIGFANAGGRVYSSHFSYVWMYNNPPFNGVANWDVNQSSLPDGTATVDTSFTAGQTLSQWLQLTGASTTPGQIAISTLKHDLNGVIAPTQSWLALNDASAGNPIMQFVFDTPIGAVANQCGKVLFNEYHVENPPTSPKGMTFPNECLSGGVTPPMTPQEKLLEYSLFELTSEGGQPSLMPTSLAFGPEAVGFTTAAQTVTWTNNSSFASTVSSVIVNGNFSVSSNTCSAVAAGASCQIGVVFTPQALGALTGTLTVVSSGNSLAASLSGTGTPGFSLSATSLSFGNLDVGATAAQTLTLTSLATGPLAVPVFTTTGPFAVNTTACGATVPALASCAITVTFNPIATGPLSGTLGVTSSAPVYSGLTATLTGAGVDFSLSLIPASGTVVAGDTVTSTATLTPIAGFAANVSLTCTVASGASATTCGLGTTTLVPGTTVTSSVSVATISQFTVIGYSGLGGGALWLVAAVSGWLLWTERRSAGTLVRSGLIVVLLAAMALSMSGCSGKLPTQNSVYTGPGNYTITVTGTDGFLVRSATYSLKVTAK